MQTLILSEPEPAFGYVLPPEASFEEWKDTGLQFMMAGRMLNWLIGDWFREGHARFGAKALAYRNRIFRRDVDRFGPIIEVCARFPQDERHKELTWGHHAVAMEADDPHAMLRKAEDEGLTVAALKAAVKVASRQCEMPIDDDPEDTAYRRIVQAWNLASRSSREDFLESAQEAGLGVIDL